MARWHAATKLPVLAGLVLVLSVAGLQAQTAKRPARPVRKPPPPKIVTAPAELSCPSPLGSGVKSKQMFCDVLTGRDPAQGIIIKLPPHRGVLTLKFDLHNRHTYSEEEVRLKKGFSAYTATIGVLTLDNTLVSRAIVQNEFRKEADLVDRISGGSGPGGLKAVAPTGIETVSIVIPEEAMQVSILGEKLTVVRTDNTDSFSAVGRPMAIVSNVMVEYKPPPPPRRPAARRPAARKK